MNVTFTTDVSPVGDKLQRAVVSEAAPLLVPERMDVLHGYLTRPDAYHPVHLYHVLRRYERTVQELEHLLGRYTPSRCEACGAQEKA